MHNMNVAKISSLGQFKCTSVPHCGRRFKYKKSKRKIYCRLKDLLCIKDQDSLPLGLCRDSNIVTFRKFNASASNLVKPELPPNPPPVSRKRKKPGYIPNQSSMGDKGGLGGIPPGGGTGDPLNDPDKLFYENLPFHGMQNPPNKPISIITPIVHTNANRLIQLPTSPSWATNQNTLNSNLQNRPKITRNKSFHGFQSNPSLNHSQGLSSTNLSNAVSTHQLPVHQFSQQDLTNIKFSSPIFSTLPHNYSTKAIRTNPNMNRSTTNMTSFLSQQPLNASNPFLTQPLGRVVGRNEHKLDIRRTASGINDYEKPKEPPTKIVEAKETKPKKEIGRFGSLELRNHRCYSPTFYSMRCKKHSKRKSMIYAILKRPKSASVGKSSSIKSSKSEPASTDYQNLTDSIQIFERSADNIENEHKDQPRPAPRCKKHRKTEIVYANISKTLRDGAETNMDSSNNSSVHDPEVSVTEAIVHETPSQEDGGKLNKPEDDQTQKIEAKTCRIITAPRPQVIEFAKKSPIPNLKVTPTVKVSPNFIKPKTESPKGALYMQLQARLKNSPNQTSQPTTNSVPPFNRSKVKKAREDEKVPDPKQKPIPEIMSVPKMPILDPELTMRKNNALNAQNAFYTLTTPHYKQATKSPTPQQYSTIPHHPKHMKLIPRSLFQDQQISKSKSFSSKAKPKKHFQIPLQKCHSFKFQTAESYFQPIKNIHEENLMRNGYGAEMAPSYHHESHHGRNHKKDKHKSQHKGPLVVRRPNEYQENVQFQENMQNSVQLQYPQPVVGRSPNGVVYADLDMPKPGSIKQYAESTMSLTKHQTQKNKPKTEYATLKFNDIGQEIDV